LRGAKHTDAGEDAFYERLIYLQAEDEVIIQGNINVTDVKQVVELAAISMAVAFGENMGGTIEEIEDSGVLDFVVPSVRDTKSPDEWAELILECRDDVVASETEQLQRRFLEICLKHPFYGSHWFYVHPIPSNSNLPVPPKIRRLPRDLILAFNVEGLHIFDMKKKKLAEYGFADIYRWGGSSSQFSLILADDSVPDSFEFCVVTAQASDMAAIILDHVRSIMADEESG